MRLGVLVGGWLCGWFGAALWFGRPWMAAVAVVPYAIVAEQIIWAARLDRDDNRRNQRGN
jgi:hypothetical protein